MSKESAQKSHEEHRPKGGRQCPQILHSPKGRPEKQTLEPNVFTEKHPDTHQSNTLANGGGKRVQDIYHRCKPLCESVVTILGLAESGDLLSKNAKDGLGGIA
jgi:hypothetical protein